MNLRIFCFSCRRAWSYYWGQNFNEKGANACPYCGRQIDSQTWENEVLPTFGAFIDANLDLKRDAAGGNAPLFAFELRNNLRKRD